MSRLSRRIVDERVFKLMRVYLDAGGLKSGLVSVFTEGTPKKGTPKKGTPKKGT